MTCRINCKKKEFLTPSPHEFGSVAHQVKNLDVKGEEQIAAKIRFGDCKDSATLQFNIRTEKDCEYMLDKQLHALTKHIDEFSDALHLAIRHYRYMNK